MWDSAQLRYGPSGRGPVPLGACGCRVFPYPLSQEKRALPGATKSKLCMPDGILRCFAVCQLVK